MLKIVLGFGGDNNFSISPHGRSILQFLFPTWKSIWQYLIYHVPLVICPEATTSCNEMFSPAYYTLRRKRCCTCGNMNAMFSNMNDIWPDLSSQTGHRKKWSLRDNSAIWPLRNFTWSLDAILWFYWRLEIIEISMYF